MEYFSMPKPIQRLFMIAKDLTTAIRAVNKAEPELMSGVKIAEDVKLPGVYRTPVVYEHPDFKNLRIVKAEVPRSSMEFDNPYKSLPEGVIANFHKLNKEKKASLFVNPERRMINAQGLMSADLFRDLAKQGNLQILKNPVENLKNPVIYKTIGDLTPSRYRTNMLSLPDNTVIGQSSNLLNKLKQKPSDIPDIDYKAFTDSWKVHQEFTSYLDDALKIYKSNHRVASDVAQSIRNVSEKTLPIAEPRLRGVNTNLVYRRMFKPKDIE